MRKANQLFNQQLSKLAGSVTYGGACFGSRWWCSWLLCFLAWGLWRGKSKKPTQLSYLASRNLVIVAGIAVPLVTVICLVGGSLMLGRSLSASPPDNALEVRITGWMWWWQIEYLDENSNTIATTANELHVPINRPIQVYLEKIGRASCRERV